MHTRPTHLFLSLALGLAAAGLWLLALTPPPAQGAPAGLTFIVNSQVDIPDADPASGCATVVGNTTCTLRGAIQAANVHPGADTIQLQAHTTYQLNRPGVDDTALNGDLDITDSVTLLGAGPDSTVIDGNGAFIGERVFQITGTVVISGVTIEHGQATNIGGGLISNGRLTLINSAIVSNTVSGVNDWGGGIYNSGPLTITNSTIRGNVTGSHNAYGGGIFNQGALLIISSTVSNNSTFGGPSSPGYGGGLFTVGYTATVVNSTFSGNTAALGGGIYKSGYPLVVINSTLAGNYSTGNGGGLYAAAGATGLYNVTIAGNRANSDAAGFAFGGGVYNAAPSTLNFINSIIALNEVVQPTDPLPTLDLDDCYGTINSLGHSLLYFVPNTCTVNGSPTIADPGLGPLQANGGPTLTMALLPGSPAIDGGDPAGCTDNVGAPLTTDQRGQPRPAVGQGLCDIGAYEFRYGLALPLVRR